MSHLIPRRAFQVFILLLCLGCLALIVCWIFSDSGLYYTLRLWTGEAWKGVALLLTFFILCIIWPLIILLWRALADLAPTKPRKGSLRGEIDQLINLIQTKKRRAGSSAGLYTGIKTARPAQCSGSFRSWNSVDDASFTGTRPLAGSASGAAYFRYSTGYYRLVSNDHRAVIVRRC